MLKNLQPQMTDPTQPVHDPLACPGVTSILLSEAASRRLLLEGDVFCIVAKTSYPQIPGRVAIFCQEIPPNVSADVCKILRGGHHAVVTTVKPIPPPAPRQSRHDHACRVAKFPAVQRQRKS
jgi:hypothetical protein